MSQPPVALDPSVPIVARYGKEYRIRRYLIALMLIGFGALFAYDGFIAWPKDNAAAKQRGLELMPHPGLDIPIQRALAGILPPLGLAYLSWILYASRGTYRLQNGIVSVPGHPDVPLTAIKSVDRKKWDRKGIAFVSYELPGGKKGTFKLDDFLYQRPPTDKIFDEIERALNPN